MVNLSKTAAVAVALFASGVLSLPVANPFERRQFPAPPWGTPTFTPTVSPTVTPTVSPTGAVPTGAFPTGNAFAADSGSFRGLPNDNHNRPVRRQIFGGPGGEGPPGGPFVTPTPSPSPTGFPGGTGTIPSGPTPTGPFPGGFTNIPIQVPDFSFGSGP